MGLGYVASSCYVVDALSRVRGSPLSTHIRKTVQVCSFLGSMCSNRMLDSVLIVAPATMLTHWLRELQCWAPGLRRVIVHKSGEADGIARVVSKGMLRSLRRWLKKAREDRVNEPIDEDDFRNPSNPEHMFCGVGYAVVTTYDNIRRSQDEWTGHSWSYVVLDEGQVKSLCSIEQSYQC